MHGNDLKNEVFKNKRTFEKFLQAIAISNNYKAQIELSKKAVKFALRNSTGYYSSDIIEKVFLKLAQQHTIRNCSIKHQKDNILHVMTECYQSGGHTRVVERWIAGAPSKQKHSLILTNSKNKIIPSYLSDVIKEHHGEIKFLSNKEHDIAKALQLRQYALQFEFVILHIHMDDYLPIIAFGSSEFDRPIILYNHADHLFWLGISIADIVADLKTRGVSSLNMRGVRRNYVLGIPCDAKDETANLNQEESRNKLGIPLNKKVLLLMGSFFKFIPYGDLDFFKFSYDLLRKREDVVILCVGPSYKYFPEKEEMLYEFQDRFFVYDAVPYKDLLQFIIASDLVIDSFPCGGGTAAIDAITYSKPFLHVEGPFKQLDYIYKSLANCKNIEELKIKVNNILNDQNYAMQNILNVEGLLFKDHSLENWMTKVENLYKICPKTHNIMENFVSNFEINEEVLFLQYYLKAPRMKKVFSFGRKLIIYLQKRGLNFKIKLNYR